MLNLMFNSQSLVSRIFFQFKLCCIINNVLLMMEGFMLFMFELSNIILVVSFEFIYYY